MYQPLLTRRYLTSKLMPLLAVVAVALCAAMVLIVWSVMGGFLNNFLASGRQMIGDVTIASPNQGIPHYEQLMEMLEEHPDIEATTPTIETLGLISLPGGGSRDVLIVGVEPEGYDEVTDYADRLYWKHKEPTKAEQKLLDEIDEARRAGDFETRFPLTDPRLDLPKGFEVFGEQLVVGDPDAPVGEGWQPAAVLGLRVSGSYFVTEEGFFYPQTFGGFMPENSITLRVVPFNRRGGFTTAGTVDREFPVANEFVTGLFQVDSRWAIIPLVELQKMLRMDATERVDPDFTPGADFVNGELVIREPEVIGTSPARVTAVLVRAREGVRAEEIEPTVKEIYSEFAALHPPGSPDAVPNAESMRNNGIYTWKNKPGLAEFIRQVESETVLILLMFAIISMVAVVLIFAIFWAMVSEKTKDVGILRSIGGSKMGIAWLFLRYGLIIGVLGAAIGGTLAYIIIRNINPIHEWLTHVTGRAIWDPAFYLFSRIPDEVEPGKAAIVLVSAVLCSVLGALIPAVRAANMDPVRALRFE
ncbi:MAG: ABC transporter permease [Phycisphaerales bacterium]